MLLLFCSACWRATPAVIDLIERYPLAEKRSSYELTQAFSVFDTSIQGTSRRTILAHPPARLTWVIVIPPKARVHAWVALRPEAWDRSGDGVVFRIGIASGDRYNLLARVHVDPYGRHDDRRWVELEASLWAYAGQTARLIFSTDVSPVADGTDARADLALWGDPEIVPGLEAHR